MKTENKGKTDFGLILAYENLCVCLMIQKRLKCLDYLDDTRPIQMIDSISQIYSPIYEASHIVVIVDVKQTLKDSMN